jgi:FkbM family methyltransferase
VDAVKSRMVGTTLGLWLLTLREKLDLVRAALSSPERIGTLANDQLASLLVASICRPGRVFVDVGAHIGSVIANTRRRSRPATICAIEAIPARAASLRQRFPAVEVFECAVGEHGDTEVSFFVDQKRSGYSSLAKPARGGPLLEIRVPLRTLDTLLQGHDVDVLKIDIEGGELGALRGAVEVLSRHRPTVMFESAPGTGARLGFSTSELWRFLDGLGYAVVAPNRLAHDDDGLSVEGFDEGHLYPRRTTNYFAVARERRIELRDRARLVLARGARSTPAPRPVVVTAFEETLT